MDETKIIQAKKEIRETTGDFISTVCITKALLDSVEPDPKKPGKYKIIDQDHMHDLYDLALELSD
jgi:hypothetical protein